MAGLAIATGNGLLLKGGKEARHSNRYLHSLVQEALQSHAPRGSVALVRGGGREKGGGGSRCGSLHHTPHQVDTREDVSDLLSLEGRIDLVIPRGGQDLVRSVMTMANGKIPVLGHTEGVCHVYIDQHADVEKALRIGECGSVGGTESHRENNLLSLSSPTHTLACSGGLQVQLPSCLQCYGVAAGPLLPPQWTHIPCPHLRTQAAQCETLATLGLDGVCFLFYLVFYSSIPKPFIYYSLHCTHYSFSFTNYSHS